MANTDNTPTIPTDAGQEIGQSGTYNYKGYISAEEYNISLTGKLGLQVYDIMRRSDPTVHAALIVCKNPIIGADWDIEPASDDPMDIEIADFVKRELFRRNISWQDTIREQLTALDFGHSVQEIVYEITEFDGKPRIGIKAIKSRKQRSILRWAIKDDKPGITQILMAGSTVEIPREKLIYVTNEREGENYEGISLLRFAYKPWKIKDALEIMNAVALERMGLGIPIITKGVNGITVGEAELKIVRSALRNMRANEESFIEVPDGVSVDMLDMKAHSTKEILPTVDHQNSQITLSVLAQFLMLGQTGGSGSRAVSADHSTLFVKSLEAVARTIQIPNQADLVNRLVDLNYSGLKNGYPRLVFSDLSDDDAAVVATAVSKLMTAGALTRDPAVENRLREMLQMPELTDDMIKNYDKLTPKLLPDVADGEQDGKGDGKDANTPGDKKTEVEDAKDDVPTDKKQTKASVLADAVDARRKVINVLFED